MAYDKTLLTDAELNTFLSAHPGWSRKGQEITRTYELPTFQEAIAFVGRVARIADARDHHPDIDIRYRKVTLTLTTHDAGGLTFRDPLVASEADQAL